jgi:hypothetical protein
MLAEWYYADQGQRQGPVTFDVLQKLAAAGALRPADLVWKPGLPQWVSASTQAGLFAGSAPVLPRVDGVSPRAPAQPWGYQPPQSSLPAPARSNGKQWIATLVIGGVVVLLATVCGVVLAVVGATAGKPSPERTWNLRTGEHDSWAIPFNQGDEVCIQVVSNFDSDVDLFVFTDEAKMNTMAAAGNIDQSVHLCIAYDNGLSKDCYVRFIAPQTGTYYVVVANRKSWDEPHRNRANSGKLTFRPVR